MAKLDGSRKWVFLFLFLLLLAPWQLAAAEPPGRGGLKTQLVQIWTLFLQVWKGETGHQIDPWGQTKGSDETLGTPNVNSSDTGPQIDPWG